MSNALCMATAVWVAALTGAVAAQATAVGQAPADAPKMRIGVFDSRMVALAYYDSEEHHRLLQEQFAQLQAARAAGDTAEIADFERLEPALERLKRYQVFSTASVSNVLEVLAPELPRIAADAGLSVIVSKWDTAFRHPSVEYVDVTDALVALFRPNARLQRLMAERATIEPTPLLEAMMTERSYPVSPSPPIDVVHAPPGPRLARYSRWIVLGFGILALLGAGD